METGFESKPMEQQLKVVSSVSFIRWDGSVPVCMVRMYAVYFKHSIQLTGKRPSLVPNTSLAPIRHP
jgi:hypothetical protein